MKKEVTIKIGTSGWMYNHWKKVLLFILILALGLRILGINWDQGYGLHPDERMIVMVVGRIGLHDLNPRFFNYGNFPIYLQKIISEILGWLIDSKFAQYAGLLLTGRLLSALFDVGTTYLVYLITKKIWRQKTALIASFLYALAVFPIQNSHFYTVDIQLTFWLTLTLYLALKYLDRPALKFYLLMGITCGLAAATKISGILGFFLPFFVLVKDFALRLLYFRKQKETSTFSILKSTLLNVIVLTSSGVVMFFLTQPYVLLDFNEFWQKITLQTQMNQDATIFPYTLQFLNTISYITPLKEIAQWGMGYPLAILSFLGVGLILIKTYAIIYAIIRKNSGRVDVWPRILLLGFLFLYFLLLGRSAVKFMRYYLPLYPMLIICGATVIMWVIEGIRRKNLILGKLTAIFIFFSLSIWPLAFLKIYLHPHPRIVATNWINENLPRNSIIAVEHWDDKVPLENLKNFQFEELGVYETETETKWNKIQSQLRRADYLIISSKRVYRSIMNWPEKYPTTTQFYQDLLAEKTNFKLFKTITNYPGFAFDPFSYLFNDDASPESFTSYDHSKVMIFARN